MLAEERGCCWPRGTDGSSESDAGADWLDLYGWASTTGTLRRMVRSMSFRYARSS